MSYFNAKMHTILAGFMGVLLRKVGRGREAEKRGERKMKRRGEEGKVTVRRLIFPTSSPDAY